MVQANIGKDLSGRIVVSFPYHPAEKHWSFPNTDSILENILKAFERERSPFRSRFTNQTFFAKDKLSCYCQRRCPKAISRKYSNQERFQP